MLCCLIWSLYPKHAKHWLVSVAKKTAVVRACMVLKTPVAFECIPTVITDVGLSIHLAWTPPWVKASLVRKWLRACLPLKGFYENEDHQTLYVSYKIVDKVNEAYYPYCGVSSCGGPGFFSASKLPSIITDLVNNLSSVLYTNSVSRRKIAPKMLWIGTRHSSASERPCTLVRNTEKLGEWFPILLRWLVNIRQ